MTTPTHSRPVRVGFSDYWDMPQQTSITVHQDDGEPVRTGLLDQNGSPIMRVLDRRPIGFDLSVEKDAP